MMKRILIVLCCTIPLTLLAQEKWSLRKCVDYAMKNNISVKQADVQARLSALQLQQSKLNLYPTASFGTGLGVQFGRSIDPTSNQFTTTKFLSQNYQLQGGAQLYNWGKLRNTVQAVAFSAQASLADIDKAANDVALNVATYYLQVLAANEQINIGQVQIAQTKAQYDNTKRKVDAGALPELNLAELEAQLASDSSNLITAKTSYTQNLLALKALMNIDMATPFDIETPPVDKIPVEPFGDLQPDVVYLLAMANQPQQKANELRIKGAEKTILASKASLYPTISGYYSLGSAFNNQAQEVTGSYTINPPIGKVNVGGTDYSVFANEPYTLNTYNKSKYFSQLGNNFNQSVGININVPIFNNGNAKLDYTRSKLDLQGLQLQKDLADQTLKSNIYTAYANAVAALEKFNAGQKSVVAAQKVNDFASKRYEVGLLSTFELITNQNNLLRAKLQQLSNQYDYVFKMKVLEFYKGLGIKL